MPAAVLLGQIALEAARAALASLAAAHVDGGAGGAGDVFRGQAAPQPGRFDH